jgi:hypothetical protein
MYRSRGMIARIDRGQGDAATGRGTVRHGGGGHRIGGSLIAAFEKMGLEGAADDGEHAEEGAGCYSNFVINM